jgi:hypothetical protein
MVFGISHQQHHAGRGGEMFDKEPMLGHALATDAAPHSGC